MEKFVTNPIIILFSYLFGIVGLILSILAYQKKKVKRLAYFIQNVPLLRKETQQMTDLHIQYKDQKINNLTLSEIYIWNDGNLTIDKNDVTDLAPLQLSLDSVAKVLEESIVHVTDKIQNWKIAENIDGSVILFDFIEPQHGVKLKILHTGNKINLTGKLKGIEVKYKWVNPDLQKES